MRDVVFDFSNHRFVVTGASSGMGHQIAIELAQAGAVVLAIARRQERLDKLQAMFPTQIVPGVADVRDEKTLEDIICLFVAKYGKLHGAVHAAGISASTPLRAYSEDVSREIMDTSFWAGIRLMQIVNKRKNSEGICSSVLFSSASAYIGEKSLFAYSAAKASLQVAVRTLAKEIYKDGRRINTVSPGWVKTEMTEKEIAATAVSEEILNRHLLGIGNPEDISGMVLFLLSDRARWITGTDIVIDGGYLLGGV